MGTRGGTGLRGRRPSRWPEPATWRRAGPPALVQVERELVHALGLIALGFGTGTYGTMIGAGGGFVLVPVLPPHADDLTAQTRWRLGAGFDLEKAGGLT
jgi:hypothetical protein